MVRIMPASENAKLREYKDLIEIVAKVEFQRLSSTNLIDLPDMVNIATHALYILFKNNDPEYYNTAYLSTAIRWAIRNEVRRRNKWNVLKRRQDESELRSDNINEVELRADLYKNILSIEQLEEGEIPTQIKSDEKTPEETIELTELKAQIKKSLKKMPPRERELIESKFFKDKKLKDIADEFNISQSRISRIIQTGLDRIKKDLKRQGII